MVGASAGAAMTLMACYGVPFDEFDCIDGDSDGYCAPSDCDDADFEIRPGAVDVPGDGIDQNCDEIDGDAPDAGPNMDGG